MAKIVYYSETNQTKKFVHKIKEYDSVRITPRDYEIEMDEPYILVMPSYEPNVHPIVIDTAEDFLEVGDNEELCKGLFGGGNRNFAELFGVTARTLSEEYGIPILHEFEFQGSEYDVNKLEEELESIDSK